MELLARKWLERVPREARLLVGVSGGVDSVALLWALRDAGYRGVVVGHVNHRLRGEESDGDERFVRDLAGRLGYAVEVGLGSVAAKVAAGEGGVEEVARRERQEWWAEWSRRLGIRRVVLAHQRDDQAETVLWNGLRGSYGWVGMRERQVMGVGGRWLVLERPFLGVRRQVLRDWLEERGEGWREDRTNMERVFTRNRLRHEALPLLSEIAGRDVVESLVRMAEAWEEVREVNRWVMDRAAVMDPAGRVHLPTWRELPGPVRRVVLHQFLRGRGVPGVGRAMIRRCEEVGLEGGVMDLPGGYRLRRRAGRLVLESAVSDIE